MAKIFTKNIGSNYLAKLVRIPEPIPHPNADKLKLVSIDNQTIIVGLNAKKDDLYIFFPLECTINCKFLSFTNSYSDPLLNSDGKTKGFFRDNGRVRAVKLRGVASEGYLAPLESFEKWILHQYKFGLDPIDIGVEFDSIGFNGEDILLCEKYIPFNQASTRNATKQKKDRTAKFDRMIPGQFHFHIDTPNLNKNIHLLRPEDTITITEKLHGTSAIFSRILVKRKLKWYEKLLQKLNVKIQDREYDNIYSSRNVIKNQYINSGPQNHYYKEDIWGTALKDIAPSLIDGLSIYAEIVGYVPGSTKCIQKNYDYGCKPGEYRIFVYRITQTNSSGDVLEYTTNQIKLFCDRNKLHMVPIHYHGIAENYIKPNFDHEVCPESLDQWQDRFLKVIKFTYLEKICRLCTNKVPSEGVVITVEKDQFTPFKLKSFAFLEQETANLDTGEVDIETEQSL